MPDGAATTGNGEYLTALYVACPWATMSSIIAHMAILAENRARPRLTPTEKLSPSLWTTSAFILRTEPGS